jgi:probable rRNA maturation factor
MIKINVIINDNNWLNYIRRPNDYLNKKISKLNLNTKELKKNHFFCTLLLSGNKQIKHLNKKFRKKNKTTDILSFPFQSKKELKKIFKKEKEIYLGDIIINLNKIQNKRTKKFFNIEFDRLWIHGLVHLFGYEHKKDEDFKKMQRIEKKYYNFVND